ncbi:MAG: ShlB/FhaC/HecB family hemolysin secretion/activation protein [Alphaproteobacteria bacterium]
MSDNTIFISFKKALFGATILATTAAIIPLAHAQVENATGIADPARAGEELLFSDELPELQNEIAIQDLAPQQAPEGAADIKFALNSLKIDGVGAYSAEEIDYIYRDQLGTTVSLEDIYGIANTLTTKYRNEGYILTQVVVPPQTIENGLVRLMVVEGFVDNITIEGEDNAKAVKQIRKYADNLRENNILDAKNLERYLLLINDLPGITARSILSPSKTTPGASDLTIVVERDKYEAEVSFDNYGSRYLGPYQLAYLGTLNSALGYNERISGQFVVAGDKDDADELLFGSVVYEQPLSRFGSKLRLIGSITSTEPGFDLDEFDVEGHSKFFSATVSHPFIRSRTTNFTGRATFDLRNVESKNDLEPTPRKDHIRSVRIGATAQFMDTFAGVGLNAFDFQVSQGIDIFGASDRGDSDLTRGRGNPHYTKVNVQAQRLQRLLPSVNLLVAGQAQWAATPLLSSEEFGVGGTTFGRGYDASEIVGDDGVSGKVELQWNEPYNVQYVTDYQLYGFWDAGRVWNQDATTSAGKRDSLASTGFGIRADILEDTQASLGVAFPLTRRVDTTNDNGPRYYFQVKHKF